MNQKVRRYQPLFSTPQPKKYTQQFSSPTSRHWKQLVSKQVNDYYLKIKNKNDGNTFDSKTPQNTKNPQTSPHQKGSKSDVRSLQSNWQASTPRKEQNLQIWKYNSISTSVNDTELKKQSQHDNYRIKLLQEQCQYLRTEFINHCRLKHLKEFEL